MKKFIFIAASICLIFGVIACTNNDVNNKKETQDVETAEELNFKSVSLSEISNLIKEDKGKIIYFSRKTCDRCLQLDKSLKEVLDKNSQEKIYLFDTDKARNENNELMKEILKEVKVESVPTIIYFEGNIEKDRYDTLGGLDELKEWFNGKM